MCHSKLRFYSKLKSCFKTENYVESVPNRNQRCWITCMRVSAHSLAIEKLRYSKPHIPPDLRLCKYCGGGSENQPKCQDNESHFLLDCKAFSFQRACFLQRLKCYIPNILSISAEHLIKTILCPSTPQIARLANKFIGIMFKSRENIDNGTNMLVYPTWDPTQPNPFVSNRLNNSVGSESSFDLSYASDF